MRVNLLLMAVLLAIPALAQNHRETFLNEGWQFSRDKATWQEVTVPHDWAIGGPFDKKWDLQVVAIKENGEDVATEKSGRSGALPWIGKGYYKTTFAVPHDYERAQLVFDGAMADPHVYVNGQLAGHWAYGYNAFIVDVTPYIHHDGTPNALEVHLENLEESNRWYPGGGIYRPVKLVMTREKDASLDTWGAPYRLRAKRLLCSSSINWMLRPSSIMTLNWSFHSAMPVEYKCSATRAVPTAWDILPRVLTCMRPRCGRPRSLISTPSRPHCATRA